MTSLVDSFSGALRKLWPHGDQHVPGLVDGIVASAPAVFDKYGVVAPLTVAMMFGQFSEECGAGLEMVENLNYSAQGLRRTWPAHFRGSMAARYAHNPRMIADVAYGGRMHNAPPPSDDGWDYRGRGPSQVTGKGNKAGAGEPPSGYLGLQEALTAAGVDVDIIEDPDLVCDPRYALWCGVADFVLCGCLPFAESGDVLNTTRRLNGGTIGLAEREQWTREWRRAMGV